VRTFSHREKVPEGRMRESRSKGQRVPHPAFGHPLPGGEGSRDRNAASFCAKLIPSDKRLAFLPFAIISRRCVPWMISSLLTSQGFSLDRFAA
jgi:hypothetical protein